MSKKKERPNKRVKNSIPRNEKIVSYQDMRGNMIKIFVWPEIAMRESTIDFKDNLVISITSPGSEHVKIKGSNVHKFHFHDVREPLELMDGSIMMPMSEDIAESIAELAVSNRDKRVLMINCEAGISRSPGVAIGIAKHLKCDPNENELKKQFPCFNTHVAKLVEESIKTKLIEVVRRVLTEELENS